MQYTDEVPDTGLTFSDFPAAHEFGEVMFLGMKRNTQVYNY